MRSRYRDPDAPDSAADAPPYWQTVCVWKEDGHLMSHQSDRNYDEAKARRWFMEHTDEPHVGKELTIDFVRHHRASTKQVDSWTRKDRFASDSLPMTREHLHMLRQQLGGLGVKA